MTSTLTPELVNRYIKSAKPFAESKIEQRAIGLATRLNSPPKKAARRRYKNGRGTLVGKIHAAAEKQPPDKIAVDSLKTLILKEIHAAFCRRIGRYRKWVDVFAENSNNLITVMAAYVATKLGIAVAIVAALVAALLRLVVKMGVAVFCKRVAQGQGIV
jgi:hypothetical protein